MEDKPKIYERYIEEIVKTIKKLANEQGLSMPKILKNLAQYETFIANRLMRLK